MADDKTKQAEVIDRNQQINVDLSVTMADLAEAYATEAESELMEYRRQLESSRSQVNKEIRELEQQLSDQADKRFNQLSIPKSAKDAAMALTNFAKLGGDDNQKDTTYKAVLEQGHVSIEDRQFTVHVLIVDADDYTPGSAANGRPGASYRVDPNVAHHQVVSYQFNQPMDRTAGKIEERRQFIEQIDESLADIRQRLAQVPMLQKQLSARISQKALSGDQVTNHQIEQSLAEAKGKILPDPGQMNKLLTSK